MNEVSTVKECQEHIDYIICLHLVDDNFQAYCRVPVCPGSSRDTLTFPSRVFKLKKYAVISLHQLQLSSREKARYDDACRLTDRNLEGYCYLETRLRLPTSVLSNNALALVQIQCRQIEVS